MTGVGYDSSSHGSNEGRIVRTQHLVQRDAVLPAGSFKNRCFCEPVHVSETEVGNRNYVRRNVQDGFERFLVENTDPSTPTPSARARSRDSGLRKPRNKAKFPALNGGQVDVAFTLRLQTIQRFGAPQECLRASSWHISRTVCVVSAESLIRFQKMS